MRCGFSKCRNIQHKGPEGNHVEGYFISTAMEQSVEADILRDRTGCKRNRVFVATEIFRIVNRPFFEVAERSEWGARPYDCSRKLLGTIVYWIIEYFWGSGFRPQGCQFHNFMGFTLLTDLGFGTRCAAIARDAIAILERNHGEIDIVFSDVVMPGMDGIELGRQVRSRWPNLTVVLTSGYSNFLVGDTRHGFALLHKPYSVDELSRVLRGARQGSMQYGLPAQPDKFWRKHRGASAINKLGRMFVR